MNTYILPVADISSDPDTWIEVVKARSFREAEDKMMERAVRDWDIDTPTDWKDFIEILEKENVIVGYFRDIEEL